MHRAEMRPRLRVRQCACVADLKLFPAQNCHKNHRAYYIRAMKSFVFLFAIFALATAAFEFTEEWELWKKACSGLRYQNLTC